MGYARREVFTAWHLFHLIAVFFLVIAPLVHVMADRYLSGSELPEDWRPWIGLWAILHTLGLIAFKAAYERAGARQARAPAMRTPQSVGRLSPSGPRFGIAPFVAAALCAGALVYLLVELGGVGGYFEAVDARRAGRLEGLGLLLSIAEALPIPVLILVTTWFSQHTRRVTIAAFGGLLVAIPLQVLVAGLRGSRLNLLWPVLILLGIAEILYGRSMSRRWIVIGLVVMVPLMYGYTFYKALGTELSAEIAAGTSLRELSSETGRDLAGTMVLDFGRVDIQSLALHRVIRDQYDLRLGATYASSVASNVGVDPPYATTKVGTTTNLVYGARIEHPDILRSSRLLGINGEMTANFGPLAFPVGTAVIGWTGGWVDGWRRRRASDDPRLLLLPPLVVILMVAFVADSDNVIFNSYKFLAVPLLIVILAGRRR